MDAGDTYDVLIMGYGPVGATFANLLGQAGHRVAIADMHRDIYDKPRAINLDQEALRLFQRIGLAAQISKDSEPHTGTDFLGVDGKLIKSIYSAPPPYPLGWPANLMFVQPEAEKHLRACIDTLENVDVYLNHTATGLKQSNEIVSAMFSTPLGHKTLNARYLIGADGANSPTRDRMGATQTDLGFSEHYVVVDAWLTRDTDLPPRTSHFCRPDAPTSYVVNSGKLRRWEMKILSHENPDDYRDLEKVKDRLSPFVDVTALKFWRSATYHFHAKVADQWRDRRIFLAGDEAHTMPPFLGQGLNSGLRDAANLSWKLSYVLNGSASQSLLDSYQVERQPNVTVVTEVSKDLGQIIGETDPDNAAARDKRLCAEMAKSGAVTVRQSLIPPIAKGFLDPDGGALAGTLAPQPKVTTGRETVLLDDLLAGFSLVKPGADHNALAIATCVETINPTGFECHDTDGVMTAYLSKQAHRALIIRPDGVIWSAPADADAAITRLHQAMRHPELERAT